MEFGPTDSRIKESINNNILGGKTMTTVVITKDPVGWNITAYTDNKEAVRKAWAMNRQQAYSKASILAEHYTDDNGQKANIIFNPDDDC